MNKLFFILILSQLAIVPDVAAGIAQKEIAYEHDGEQLQGHLYWDDTRTDKRPGVIVVHEWWGLDDYAKERAIKLAKMGYVAFAIDMYGVGKVTEHPDKAGEWMKINTSNVERWRDRALTALALLKQSEWVDNSRLAAIGYCFGGATVMQMAYAGADLDGVVSFHGSLPLPDVMLDEGEIKTKILVAHGGKDPFVSKDKLIEFETALENLKADVQVVIYAGAKHSFTNPGADARGMEALQYSPDADRRSWQQMQMFFAEIFAENRELKNRDSRDKD